jgi:hypothetical protein
MPISVRWKHVLLDHTVFIASGTYRVARVPGGINAFPVPEGASGQWDSPQNQWTPRTSGSAPAYYLYHGKQFNFGFWSVKVFRDESFYGGNTINDNAFFLNYPAGIFRLEATAIYYWDFADKGGGHGVYIDAFDDTRQEFIADDFVDVIPDDAKGQLTAEANNGYLDTNKIPSSVIRARSPMGDNVYRQYAFSAWTNEQDLSRFGAGTVPVIDGRDIRVSQGSVIAALAHYNPLAGAPINPVVIPHEGGQIIGIPADGTFLFIPHGGVPQVVGPWNPLTFTAQLANLTTRMENLQKKIDQLEKPH